MSDQYGIRDVSWPRQKPLPPVEEPCPKCGGRLSQNIKYPTAAHPIIELIVSCYNKSGPKWNDFCGFIWRRSINLGAKESAKNKTAADTMLLNPNEQKKKQIKAVKPKTYKRGMRRYKSK